MFQLQKNYRLHWKYNLEHVQEYLTIRFDGTVIKIVVAQIIVPVINIFTFLMLF